MLSVLVLMFTVLVILVSCVLQVNSKSTLLFSGLVNEEVHKSIFWPELPYVNDGHGSELRKMAF